MTNVAKLDTTNYEQKYQMLTRELARIAKSVPRNDIVNLSSKYPCENNGYSVFELDTGAQYWIAAPDIRAALKVVQEISRQEGWHEDVEEVSLSKLSTKAATEVQITLDAPGQHTASAHSLAIQAEKPELIGCSEW